jgi:glycosyltransferase involved in cell wall biosynthesis
MEKITFCIPSKSNLRYLKTCIPSIRENAHRKDHDIIIFVDSDEDGTVEWLEHIKDAYNVIYFVNPDLGNGLFGIGKAYDYCIEHSTTNIFMIFHADMMLGKDADLKAFNHLKPQTVVCATRIEPPIHPNAGEKILLDFGMWPEEFKQTEFNQYVEEHLSDTKITNGIFAPWMMYKTDFMELGGHDPILHSCREDSDIFNRMQLAGYKFIQLWNSLVYHLTGRGAGSFDGDAERHSAWKAAMDRSTMEFIRKWGSTVNHTALLEPIVLPKYNIAFRVENCTQQLLSILEPWCDRIYSDAEWMKYITLEQSKTMYNLRERCHSLTGTDRYDYDDIIVEIDGSRFTQQDFAYIQRLSEILNTSDLSNEFSQPGEQFELGNLKITIMSVQTYEKNIIKVKQ